MSLSELPLSYCTNVHPGRTVREVEDGLDRYTVPVMRASGQPLAAGLWLARSVVTELLKDRPALQQFAERLSRRGLSCHTLNAFPYGDFHREVVKHDVYLPACVRKAARTHPDAKSSLPITQGTQSGTLSLSVS